MHNIMFIRVIRNETLCLFLLLNIHSYINFYGWCFINKIKLALLVRTIGKEEMGLWFLFLLLNKQRIEFVKHAGLKINFSVPTTYSNNC